MSKLSESIECKSKFIIRKRLVNIKCFLCSYSNFEFVFSSSICNYFPIMNSIEKWSIRCYCSEIIIGFIQKCMFKIFAKCNFFWWCIWIPRKFITSFWIKILYLVFYRVIKLVFVIAISKLSFEALVDCPRFIFIFFKS